jgi:hypothetical protein
VNKRKADAMSMRVVASNIRATDTVVLQKHRSESECGRWRQVVRGGSGRGVAVAGGGVAVLQLRGVGVEAGGNEAHDDVESIDECGDCVEGTDEVVQRVHAQDVT